jgi:hypothetical protein
MILNTVDGMNWKRRMAGGGMGLIGFILSPLSWWNDLVVNVPLAAGFGWLVSLLYRPAFEPGVVVGYWLTNVVGLVLLHKGAQQMVSAAESRPYSRRDFLRDVAISLAYTLVIVALIHWRILKPIGDFFKPAAT